MLVSPTRLMVIQSPLRPALDLNFLSGNLDSRITFTRASTAWAYNSAGTLTSYSSNVPRFDYDPATLAPKGLLIEEARTNSIRNSSAGGAVAGSAGTLPTNWNQPSLTTGITRTVVGTGTSNGLPYVDIQYSGTASGSTDTVIFFESSSNIAATNATTWTSSTHIALVGGSLSGVTVKQGLRYRAAAGASIASQVYETTIVPTSTLARYATTATGADATIAFVVPSFVLTLAAGAINVTFRHAVPQCELGGFASSPILTTTAAVTRAVDAASIGTLTPWFNTSAGTLLCEFQRTGFPSGALPRTASFSDGTTSNLIELLWSSSSDQFSVVTGGVSQAMLSGINGGTAQTKFAGTWEANNVMAYVNGSALGVLDTVASIPTVTQLQLGNRVDLTTARQFSGYLRSLRYYNKRLPDATLQRITT